MRRIVLALSFMTACSASNADPLDGASLHADVVRYQGFGHHRYGSPGAAGAFDWIADELQQAGLSVAAQKILLARQYDFASGSLTVDGRRFHVMPQWWVPESAASFRLSAPIVASGEAKGAFVHITLPYDRAPYLSPTQRAALAAAFARQPAAVLATVEHPSNEIYTFNVDQTDPPWPVPVVVLAGKDKQAIDAAIARGAPVTLEIAGRYRHDVSGRNVIGRLDRKARRTIVISTPVTSWFESACERGPGIAGFLAVARLAKARFKNVNLVLVATDGHEIGHGGIEDFIKHEAPTPDSTAAWVHFGASLACYNWRWEHERWVNDSQVDTRFRVLARSQPMDALVRRHFAAIAGVDRVGESAAVGELRDVHAAGYANFFGVTGLHTFFHTPADTADATGPKALSPVIRAYVAALDELDAAEGARRE